MLRHIDRKAMKGVPNVQAVRIQPDEPGIPAESVRVGWQEWGSRN
jgi:hypothetical protein